MITFYNLPVTSKNIIKRIFVMHMLLTHGHPNQDSHRTMFLLANPQFLRNHYKTWSKWGTHKLLIYTKFRNDFIKIVDFLIKA